MPNEDRLTRADLEILIEFARKNRFQIYQKGASVNLSYL
jgi:hypothetical protein